MLPLEERMRVGVVDRGEQFVFWRRGTWDMQGVRHVYWFWIRDLCRCSLQLQHFSLLSVSLRMPSQMCVLLVWCEECCY